MKKPTEIVVGKTELRKFGYVMAGFFALIFGLVFPWLWSLKWPLWPWIVAGTFLSFAVVWPSGLAWVYKFWMRFAKVLEWINTRIILGTVFFLVFVPLGVAMRMLGRDTLQKKFKSEAATYRVDRVPRKNNHMERQF